MVQKRTAARFAEWVKVPENIEGFYALMERSEKPLRFRDACVESRVPYTLMHAHMKATAELKARYYAILAARSQQLVEETLEDAEQAKGKDSAVAAKVRIGAKQWVAAKWDRELYGEMQADAANGQAALVDAALLGTATELLRLAREKRQERVVAPVEPKALEAE